MKRGRLVFPERNNVLNFILVTIVLLILIFLIKQNFTPITECRNYDCFQEHMNSCSPVVYINENPEATWKYEVTELKEEGCETFVTLLQAKEGDLELNRLVNEKMSCYYEIGKAAYLEKDLSKCHGRLKEDLQSIIIKKLYGYIVENIEDLDENIKNSV